MQHRRLTKPTFQFFANWLEEWADISRLNKDTSLPRQAQSYATATSSNLQRISPGESKEYRDSQRNRRRGSLEDDAPNFKKQKYSAYSNQTPAEPLQPQAPLKQKMIGDSSTQSCTWCNELGSPNNHKLSECLQFPNTNALDQWRFIYAGKACSKCLSPDHYWRQCHLNLQLCPRCNIQHHQKLQCRPLQPITRNLASNAK